MDSRRESSFAEPWSELLAVGNYRPVTPAFKNPINNPHPEAFLDTMLTKTMPGLVRIFDQKESSWDLCTRIPRALNSLFHSGSGSYLSAPGKGPRRGMSNDLARYIAFHL